MAEKPEELTEHTVMIGGLEHTMLLSEEDAARYEEAAPKSKAKTPANKARSAESK
jgi:hypothetical protein